MKHVEEKLEGPQHAGVVAETLNCQRQEALQSTSPHKGVSQVGEGQFPSTAGQSTLFLRETGCPGAVGQRERPPLGR